MRKYRAVLISPDGESWVTDFGNSCSINEVWDKIENTGSRWFFYPIRFVINEPKGYFIGGLRRIAAVPDDLEFLKGLSIRTVAKWIKNNPKFIQDLLSQKLQKKERIKQ